MKFPDSTTRAELMAGLEGVLRRIESAAVPCEIWVDGSFLTEEVDPDDVDIVIWVDGDLIDHPPTVDALNTIEFLDSDLRTQYGCDNHLLPLYREDHPAACHNEGFRSHFRRVFGSSLASQRPKGIAVVSIGGESR